MTEWKQYGFTTPLKVLKISGQRYGEFFIEYAVTDSSQPAERVLAVCKDKVIAEQALFGIYESLGKVFGGRSKTAEELAEQCLDMVNENIRIFNATCSEERIEKVGDVRQVANLLRPHLACTQAPITPEQINGCAEEFAGFVNESIDNRKFIAIGEEEPIIAILQRHFSVAPKENI